VTPRVLGIDPSLTATGIACSDGWTKTIGEPGKKIMTYLERYDRARRVLSGVLEIVRGNSRLYSRPVTHLIVIEGPSYRSGDPSAFDRAGLWWHLFHQLTVMNLPIAVAAPTVRAKYATGKGTAGKGAVIDAVARRFPDFETNGDDNVCDAIVLMAIGRDKLGHPIVSMPQAHRAVLDSVAWPDTLPTAA
jgi:Holliday junction resolvasome RuvABC endonuclease subunit